MSCSINSSDINQTFVIEPTFVNSGITTVSACTAIYTNTIIGCDFDTQIILNSGETQFNTSIATPIVNLGLDTSGNTRLITADSIILNGDILSSGEY